MRRFFRRLAHYSLRILAVLVVLLLAAGLAGFLIFRSGWFREKVRERIVTEVEKATGGRVELGTFEFDWATLSAKVSPLVLHGKEGAGEPPLLRASSVTAGLRIISALEQRVDLSSLRVEGPQVRIVFYADGSTNLPTPPGPPSTKVWSAEILNLAVKNYEISNGLFEYDNRKIPLNIRGEDLSVRMNYDAATPAYSGEAKSGRVRVLPNGLAPFEVALESSFRIEKSRIVFPKVNVSAMDTHAEASGTLDDPRDPHGSFKVKATGQVRDAVRMFGVPLKPTGSVTFDGTMNIDFRDPFHFGLDGKGSGRGLGYTFERLNIDNADARADLKLSDTGLTLTNISAKALGAEALGKLDIVDWKRVHVEGSVNSLEVRQASHLFSDVMLPWSGVLRGSFKVDTTKDRKDTVAIANLDVLPGGEGRPIQGNVDVRYDEAANQVDLGQSYLATPASRLDLSGVLGKTLAVKFHSMDLDDILPALALAGDNAPKTLPLKLAGGSADADGTVTGTLDNPEFRGQVLVTKASVEGHAFDRFEAAVDATKDRVQADRATLVRGNSRVTGSAGLEARAGSFENAGISGTLALQNISLEEILKEAKSSVPVTGMLAATVTVGGSVKEPQASGTVDIQKPLFYGQQLDRLHATVKATHDSVEITGGQADDGPARVLFSGSYQQAGDVRFQVRAQNLTPERIEMFSKLQPPLGGTFTGTAEGRGRIHDSKFELLSADGNISVANFTVEKQPIGNLAVAFETRGDQLGVKVNGKVRDSTVEGEGSWRLTGDDPGSVSVKFSRMDVQTVHHLAMLGGTAEQEASDLPFDGFLEGHATATASLKALEDFQAEVTLDTIQVRPKPSLAPKAIAPVADIELHNTKPVVLTVTAKSATIKSAQFAGRETTIEASGSVPFTGGASADITVRGDLNMSVLQLLSPDLTATGKATMQATARGVLRDPLVSGRMELKGASLYFGDLPNGLDNANGVVLFDRKRATIEKLTAETGGGKLALSGFLEFGTSILYRLQADAKSVRVRWPEDLSTTFDAKLALNGSPDQSTLSGTLTLNRATFNSRADLGSFFANSTKPVPTTGSPNDLLRGMQFDVRIESGNSFQFETSLTRDVEADVELRLRGTPLRPVLLGDISVNQGEIQLFGNRYTVNRGDIHFLNPVKIEPTLDLELETKARGITVNISLSGTMDKLKPNYSSDPPMQSNDIIALLAVGRDPSLASSLAANTGTGGAAGFTDTGLGLLGEAASEQLSSRLQRFIGSSRVKIDPTLTGVDNLPQARLTIEQQVSKDVTLTYITNLNRTQEQIVRVQWDFNRSWSAVAVRDSNGLFGIDFQYRKRF
jgi:translocation and assembly module TamB